MTNGTLINDHRSQRRTLVNLFSCAWENIRITEGPASDQIANHNTEYMSCDQC